MSQNKLKKIFLVSILLSAFANAKPNISEPENTLANNYKISDKKRSFIYSKNINHRVIGSRIITRFAPKSHSGQKISLDELALDWGYDHFNWVNYVERDPYGMSDRAGQVLSTPYNDPPVGGYVYDSADRLPFYWDLVHCDRCQPHHHRKHFNNLKQNELIFQDSPADYRLQPGEAVEFVTSLVGVKKYDVANQIAEWEVLYTFRWQLANPVPGYGQISLIETDVDLNKLSPVLLDAMILDGAASIDFMSQNSR